MKFDAERVSLELLRALRVALERLHRRNPALADQARRAATSIALNISEGRRRAGKDRIHLWRIAAGSAAELRTALAAAEAWGWLTAEELAPAREFLDRVMAMLWRLCGPARVGHPPAHRQDLIREPQRCSQLGSIDVA